MHFAWCAPVSSDSFNIKNPPSSDPLKIYWRLKQDTEGSDLHSAGVTQNRLGLMRGADVKAAAGLITPVTQDTIKSIVDLATLKDFTPLLLVIPFDAIKATAEPVPIGDRANSTSEEYIIRELPRAFFDILQIDGTA